MMASPISVVLTDSDPDDISPERNPSRIVCFTALSIATDKSSSTTSKYILRLSLSKFTFWGTAGFSASANCSIGSSYQRTISTHAIAKEIKKTSKEVLDILAERGYELKSASSTIDNITAESLIEEFKSDDDVSTDPESSDSKNSASETQSDTKPSKIPLVKSKEDIEREKKEKEEAEQAEQERQAPTKSVSEEEAPEVEAPDPVKPTMAPPPPPSTKASAPPPPVSAGKPQVPPPPASAGIDKTEPSEQDGIVEGNLVIVKPPIVVRDFAVLLGLKPFQLISEL